MGTWTTVVTLATHNVTVSTAGPGLEAVPIKDQNLFRGSPSRCSTLEQCVGPALVTFGELPAVLAGGQGSGQDCRSVRVGKLP